MRDRILLTGATDGIGRALAARLAPRADLLLAGRRAVPESLPEGATHVAADQSDPERAAATIGGALDRLGWERLDYAVLNAGTGFAADPADETDAVVRLTLDTNLGSAIALAQMLAPRLEAARGRLVLVGSTARRGAPGFASYAASKAGLHGLARALTEEWRGRIGVTVVHPGPVATGMHDRAGHRPHPMMRRFFAHPEAAAAGIERAMRSGRTVATLNPLRLLLAGRNA